MASCYKKVKWYIEDCIFCIRIWFSDYIIEPFYVWYFKLFGWKKKWVRGCYSIEDDTDNFWLTLGDEDIYVTPDDFYYKYFKDFKNGTKFKCHLVWNSNKNKPKKISDIRIIKSKRH